MTIDEIKVSDKTVLTVRDVAPVVGLSAERLRDQAKKDPRFLGFPTIVADGNVRIPRLAFVRFMEGSRND